MRHTCCGSAVIERLGTFLSTHMQTAQPDLEEASIALVVSCVSVISKRQLVIENLSQSGSIRGATETEGGMIVARDGSLPHDVVEPKLAQASAAAAKYFMGEWIKSTKE